MNKKIKVIELLNKIYENLDVPERVKLDGVKYEWDDKDKVYRDEGNNSIGDNLVLDKWLEDEVEILANKANKANKEDEEEIDIQDIEELQIFSDSTVYDYNDVDRNRKVINDLVKAVKQLDKKINKED